MLKLKKLQILGFKSFCDRTELRFHGDGVAAIVGPNGCGKSNISDAICWVLGEQSAKSLRGSRMEDVIFAGTPARKATGMAEVSLTLIDPDVYQGSDANAEPEIEIRDEMPEEDWDEEALRAAAEEESHQYAEEVQPGVKEEIESTAAQPPVSVSAEESDASAEPPAISSEAGAVTAPQVVLKIRRRKFKALPLKQGEVIVTRRLFRSGESEYLLNHKLCRLRDIQDIFMGTGLGPESYAIIEQGRIGQILSSKPTDRRAIIEEAAGVTKFKQRKRLAEARLEDSKQNLARLNDIFEEVTRQMNSLKRQAAKAARHAKLRDEMRATLRTVLASRFALLDQDSTRLHVELQGIGEELQQRGEAVRAMEAENTECTQRGYALNTEAQQARERLNEIALESSRAATRRQQNEERCAELQQRSELSLAEMLRTQERRQALVVERDANSQIVQSAAAEVAAARDELNARQHAASEASRSLAELEQSQEQCRNQIFATASEAAGLRNRITQAEERMAGLERDMLRLTGEINSANLQLESFGGERGQLALEFESAAQEVAALTQQISQVRQQIEEKKADEVASKRHLDGLRAEYASALGKKSSLEAVIAEHGYATDSVQRLFRSGALHNGFAPVGVLADFLEVESRYEHVVEDFLRDELNYVVVKSWDAADAGLQLLRTDVDVRATFMVHPNDSQARFSFMPAEAPIPNTATRPGAVTPLKNCIRVLDGFGKSLEVILPKLRDGYIVPDPSVARSLALENPDAFFLSETGEQFHNVTVTGGKQPAEGPLSMKRELREVMRQLGECERAVSEEETRVAGLGREIAELTSLLERLDLDKRDAEKQAMTSDHTLRQLDAEMTRVRERLATYECEVKRTGFEREEQNSFLAEQRNKLAEVEARTADLELTMADAQQRLEALRAARDAAAQATSEAMARVATLEERRRSADHNLGRIDSLVNEVTGRVQALESQIAAAVTEQEERRNENVRIGEQLEALTAEREVAQAHESALLAEIEQVRARLAELEVELRTAREALDVARDRRGEIAAAVAKLESDVAHMSETALTELGATREGLLADESIVRAEGEQLANKENSYREMRNRLEAMGPVNMMALEEYNEVAQRHGFLEIQRKDLLEAIENTQNTIKEIETISRQKFEEAFEKINANFGQTFRKLFGGGQAFMRLTDLENSTESGIDVVASPPGKKLQNVLLLSGGEKALTALSLLVGIFQYQPSPFCILDEVDAPLDDANIGRFTELVKEMSLQTQFVLITHSKKTMSIAPVMYGVTMQEPGVSRLVSVRFEGQAVN